jgi:hypothetical protein
MDYLQIVRAMLDDFGHDPAERMGPLMTALGTGIAACTVLTDTKESQDKLLEMFFQCVREDAMERFHSYDRFLHGDKTFSMPTPGSVQ